MDEVRSWLRQPTTVAGIAAAMGTAMALLLHLIDWIHATPLLAGAAMSILLPDNTTAKQRVEELTTSIVYKPGNIKELNR